MDSIPVIDLGNYSGDSAAPGNLIRACEEWGSFRLVNFGGFLTESMMQEMAAVVRSLMDLPTAVKARNREVITGSGYLALSATNKHYECLGVYDLAVPPDVAAFCSDLKATPHQRDTMLKYAKAVHELMMDVAHKMGQGLGLNNSALNFEDWSCLFTLNKYHFGSNDIGAYGVRLHTDSGFFTLLQDDETVSGLEVMKRNGEFQPVESCPGTLVCTLGDMAKVWSNGRFLSVKHQVRGMEVGVRVSVASSILGPKEGKIDAPPELIDLKHPRVFVPFTYEESRNLRFSKNLNTGQAIEYFQV